MSKNETLESVPADEVEETEETGEETIESADAIEFDLELATSEDAPAGLALLAPVVPLFNELVTKHRTFLAQTNTGEAEKAYIESPVDSADQELATQIKQARALIERNTALLAEHATAYVAKQTQSEGFDKTKAKAELNDLKSSLRDTINGYDTVMVNMRMIEKREVVEMKVIKNDDGTEKTVPTGKTKTETVALNKYGEMYLKVKSGIPRKFEPSESSTNSADDSPSAVAKREVRRDAKEWGRKQGMTVAERGALSGALLEKYFEANPSEKEKWDKANS